MTEPFDYYMSSEEPYRGGPMGAERYVLLVIAADVNDMPMDCCDDDPVHVWVWCLLWSPRRAFLTQGTPFLEAAGLSPSEAESVVGMDFYGHLDLPPYEPDSGERIEITGLEVCPPLDDVIERLEARQKGCDPR